MRITSTRGSQCAGSDSVGLLSLVCLVPSSQLGACGLPLSTGIIPGAGDAADAALNYLLVVRKARQAEIPGWLLRKMLANNAVSAGVGLVPVVGDIILAAYKANSRNAALLEEFLRIR